MSKVKIVDVSNTYIRKDCIWLKRHLGGKKELLILHMGDVKNGLWYRDLRESMYGAEKGKVMVDSNNYPVNVLLFASPLFHEFQSF